MAPPFVALTSLDGEAFVCVCRSEKSEDRASLMQRARERIDDIAIVDTHMVNLLHRNLEVIPLYRAIQDPYRTYLDTAFDFEWIQAQADQARRVSR